MIPSFCPYKYALGIPGQGIHKYRIFNIAIADVVMTFIGAGILSYLLNISYWIVLPCLFVLGIILHRLFCVRTTIDKFIFGE
jgi:fatty acid desaturase